MRQPFVRRQWRGGRDVDPVLGKFQLFRQRGAGFGERLLCSLCGLLPLLRGQPTTDGVEAGEFASGNERRQFCQQRFFVLQHFFGGCAGDQKKLRRAGQFERLGDADLLAQQLRIDIDQTTNIVVRFQLRDARTDDEDGQRSDEPLCAGRRPARPMPQCLHPSRSQRCDRQRGGQQGGIPQHDREPRADDAADGKAGHLPHARKRHQQQAEISQRRGNQHQGQWREQAAETKPAMRRLGTVQMLCKHQNAVIDGDPDQTGAEDHR
ncbi:MAG: hypothetical protein FWC42_02620 [Proteobacteria bacterium]|nr:hypothetical protein [Pseudomonadota bacterium]